MMIDFSHPYTPNVFSDAYAANQLQNYFNNIQTQQDVRAAGQIGATGDLAGMRNALLGSGHIEQAGQTQNLLHAMDQQELEHRNDTYQLLGRAASLYGNDPDKWAQIVNLVKSRGGNVQGLEDPNVGPAMMRGIAQTAQQNFENEMKRRQVDATIAKLSQTYTDKDGNIWARTPTGQWINQGKPPAGIDISEPVGGKEGKYEFKMAGANPMTGEGGYPLVLNKGTGEVTRPKIGGKEEPEAEAAPQLSPMSAPGAMPPATSAIPAAATLPVPGTKGGEPAEPTEKFNEDALKGLDPGVANTIRAMNAGTFPIPKNPRTNAPSPLVSKLFAYNPDFNWRDIDQAYRYRQDFMKATGKRQNEGISFNTAVGHGADAINDSDFLPSGSKLSTVPGNFYQEFSNDPRLGKLLMDVNILAGEATKVLHGGPSVTEEEALRKSLDPTKGKESFQAAAATLMQRMKQKADENAGAWRQNMKYLKMPPEMQEYWVMTPESSARLNEAKTKLVKSGNPAIPEQWTQKQDLKSMSDDEILKALKAQ